MRQSKAYALGSRLVSSNPACFPFPQTILTQKSTSDGKKRLFPEAEIENIQAGRVSEQLESSDKRPGGSENSERMGNPTTSETSTEKNT